MIVNFAVVNNLHGTVFVRHRLMPCGDIHDAQTTMAQSNLSVNQDAFIVRPAMRKYVAHTPKLARVHAASRPTRKGYPVNSTHKRLERSPKLPSRPQPRLTTCISTSSIVNRKSEIAFVSTCNSPPTRRAIAYSINFEALKISRPSREK